MRRAAALILPALFIGAPLAAEEEPGLYGPLPGIEYYCRDADGGRREVGEVMCITASCQTWMARCEMSTTRTFTQWRKMQDGCPGVSVQPSGTGAEHFVNALKNTL